jgi:hypothetical protein
LETLLRAQALAASVAQERQASYMYIMPLEHASGRDNAEARPLYLYIPHLHRTLPSISA